MIGCPITRTLGGVAAFCFGAALAFGELPLKPYGTMLLLAQGIQVLLPFIMAAIDMANKELYTTSLAYGTVILCVVESVMVAGAIASIGIDTQ